VAVPVKVAVPPVITAAVTWPVTYMTFTVNWALWDVKDPPVDSGATARQSNEPVTRPPLFAAWNANVVRTGV
jgi:hypothetical protein